MKFSVKDDNKISVTVTNEDLCNMKENGVAHIDTSLSDGNYEIKIIAEGDFIIMESYFSYSTTPWPVPMWKNVDRIVKNKVKEYYAFFQEENDL